MLFYRTNQASGVEARCEIVGGSFFDGVPAGADAYIMRTILHDWDDEGFVTLPVRRARSVSASWMVRPLRLQSATWSSRHREVRGAFGRR